LSNQCPLPFLHQISDKLVGAGIPDDRAAWHLNKNVFALPPLLALAPAVGTSLGLEVDTALEADECVQVSIDHQVYIATLASIPTVRSSQRHIFLTAEAHTSVPAVTGLNEYLGFIEEHGNHFLEGTSNSRYEGSDLHSGL
jgi:hypothetical protein